MIRWRKIVVLKKDCSPYPSQQRLDAPGNVRGAGKFSNAVSKFPAVLRFDVC